MIATFCPEDTHDTFLASATINCHPVFYSPSRVFQKSIMSNDIDVHLQNIANKRNVDSEWTEIRNVLQNNNDSLSQLLFNVPCEDVVTLPRE